MCAQAHRAFRLNHQNIYDIIQFLSSMIKAGSGKKERAVQEPKESHFIADLIKRTGIPIAAVYFSE